MNPAPLISILVPVYNSELFIEESIQSILTQDYSNFELILINDGSTDGTGERIKKIKDPRIRYFYQENRGLAAVLNRGLSLAKGELIARQDGDDISLPGRFREQVDFLNKHPNIGLVGCWTEIVNEKGESGNRFHRHACESDALRLDLLFNNPFVHSSVMFRRSIIEGIGYTESPEVFEDYHLWSLLGEKNDLANIPLVLVRYREVGSSISRSTQNYKRKVFNQSFNNLSVYLEAGEEKKLVNLLGIYHYYHEVIDSKYSLHALSEFMQTLIRRFMRAKRMNDTLAQQIRKHQNLLQRSYYSYRADRPGAGLQEKFVFKVKRRLFLSSLNGNHL